MRDVKESIENKRCGAMKEAIITYHEKPDTEGDCMVDHWQELIRCKDCRHYTGEIDGYCEKWFRKTGGNLFFCADGEK